MQSRSRIVGRVLAVLVAAGIAAAVVTVAFKLFSKLLSGPDSDLVTADRVTLFSIDGRDSEMREPGTGEMLHGYPVFGKVEVTDPGDRRRLDAAFKESLANGTAMAGCFWPHHILRLERDGRTTDYVICFYCVNYRLYVNGEIQGRHRPISRDAEPVFNKLLEDAKVPIAPKWPP